MNMAKFKRNKEKTFEVWSEGGKYYYKSSRFAKKQEVTKEEFENILNKEPIVSLQISQERTLGLEELIRHYNQHCDLGTSEFGRRVRVVLLEGEQKESKTGGVDVQFTLDLIDEGSGTSSDDLYTITVKLEGVTGPLTDKGVYYPEAFRALYQLAFNGCLANKEDHEAGRLALKM